MRHLQEENLKKKKNLKTFHIKWADRLIMWLLLNGFLLPGPLLVWDSSVIGGSASSWIVGTDANRPVMNTHTHWVNVYTQMEEFLSVSYFNIKFNRILQQYTPVACRGLHWQREKLRLTESSVVRQLLVNLLHPLDVEATALRVVNHRFGIVHAHHTVGRLLDRLWCVPRLVDVTVGIVLQDGNVTPAGKSSAKKNKI